MILFFYLKFIFFKHVVWRIGIWLYYIKTRHFQTKRAKILKYEKRKTKLAIYLITNWFV